MTRVNDYLWQLPHEAEADDPPDIAALIEAFNQPFIDLLGEPMAAHGYTLSGSDVMVKLDEEPEDTTAAATTYYANVRFVKYLTPNIMTRVHFEHNTWALLMPKPEMHQFFVNLDRFKIVDATKQVVPSWEGRLHTRLSSTPGDVLFFEDMDQIWTYRSSAELDQLLALFVEKFEALVIGWLEDLGGIE